MDSCLYQIINYFSGVRPCVVRHQHILFTQGPKQSVENLNVTHTEGKEISTHYHVLMKWWCWVCAASFQNNLLFAKGSLKCEHKPSVNQKVCLTETNVKRNNYLFVQITVSFSVNSSAVVFLLQRSPTLLSSTPGHNLGLKGQKSNSFQMFQISVQKKYQMTLGSKPFWRSFSQWNWLPLTFG